MSKTKAAPSDRVGVQVCAIIDRRGWQGRCYQQYLVEHGPMSPDELGKRLGMSEDAAASLLAHLVREGKAA